MSVGTLVIDERIYPIGRITLAQGLINFWLGPLAAPVEFPAASEVRIHDRDGALVGTAPWNLAAEDMMKLRGLSSGDTAHVCFPVAVEFVGWPRFTDPVATVSP